MNILVTGGLGFMGSNLIRHLYRHYPDYRIWNLDLITYAGNPDNLRDIEEKESEIPFSKKRYHFVRGDICDESLLNRLFKKYAYDAVIHFAAETHVDRSIADTRDFIKTNVNGTHVLLEIIRRYPLERFIHISTDEVYGDRYNNTKADETSQLRPSNPYAASKAAGDLLVQSYVKTYQMPAIIVRPSNYYGPYQYPEKLIPLAISNMLENKKFPLHGSGEYIRSWLYTEDACRALVLLLHEGRVGEIYNISGVPKSNISIVTSIAKRLGKDPSAAIEYVNDRPGQDKRYDLESKKIHALHHWKRQFTFEQAFMHTIDWYLANRAWWEKIKSTKAFKSYYKEQCEAKWF